MARPASSHAHHPPAAGAVTAEPALSSTTGTVRFLLVLMSLAIIGPLSIDMYLPALPTLQRDLGASASQAQLTLSACLLGLASGQLIAGPLSDRFGRRPPAMIGIAGFALMSLLCALAPSITFLIAFRFLQGLSGSAGVVVSRAVVRDTHSGARAAQMFSLLVLAIGVGPILAPTIGGIVLLVTGWRGVFGALAALGLVLLTVTWRFLPETNRLDTRSVAGVGSILASFGVLLRDRLFIGYALVMAMGMSTMMAHVAGSSFVMQNLYGVSEQMFGVLFGVIAIGYIGMSQVNGRLVARIPLRRLLAFGVGANLLGALVVFAVVNLLDAGIWVLTGGLLLVAMSNGFIGPNVTALSLNDYPRMAGSASAMLGLLTYASGAVVAPLVGIAGEETAVPLTLVILGCSLIGLTVLLTLARPRSPVQSNDAAG